MLITLREQGLEHVCSLSKAVHSCPFHKKIVERFQLSDFWLLYMGFHKCYFRTCQLVSLYYNVNRCLALSSRHDLAKENVHALHYHIVIVNIKKKSSMQNMFQMYLSLFIKISLGKSSNSFIQASDDHALNLADIDPDSKVHGANMGPIWGRRDPGGPHVGTMNFAIWGGYQKSHVFLWFFPTHFRLVLFSLDTHRLSIMTAVPIWAPRQLSVWCRYFF